MLILSILSLNSVILCPRVLCSHFRDVHGTPGTKGPGSIPLQDQHLALAILLELAVQRGTLR